MGDDKRKVAVILVNWNLEKYTSACIASLLKLSTKNIRLSIIVVDNGSTDNSVSEIEKKFPEVIMLQSVENLGFTGGNNHGIRYGLKMGFEFIWLLNNDTVVDTNALVPLVAACESANVGIAGSKIYFSPGREYHRDRYLKSERGKVIWYAGGQIDWNNMYASHRGVDDVDHGQFNRTQETPFVTGCSMMIRREVFDRIGLLDDRYFLYLEDLDFSLRAKHAGFTLLYVPDSVLWHENAGSTDKPGNTLHEYYQTRNRLLAGFAYAPARTRFALMRESFRFALAGPAIKRSAVWDAYTNKFGNRYTWKS